MLSDPVEIEIASGARQPGIRDPNRPRKPFDRIFEDFLVETDLRGRRLIDLGPGQWDFAELARDRGAASVTGIDNDEAVLELGRYKRFDARAGDLREVSPDWLGTFDGVFCKFSLSAFWGEDAAETSTMTDRVAGLVAPGGWAWIAPWNGTSRALDAEERRALLVAQAQAFERGGFSAFCLSKDLAQRYGVTGAVENHALFVRNLDVSPVVSRCPAP